MKNKRILNITTKKLFYKEQETIMPNGGIRITPSPYNRFWSYVKKKKNSCWLWTGAKSDKGYGHINISHKLYLVHRLSYEIHFGKFNESLFVLHKCDIRNCVNPNDLFLGTMQDNMHDRDIKERQARGEKQGNSILKEKDILKIRKLYINGSHSYNTLAEKFGVSSRHIYSIINRQRWKHI